MSGVRVPGSGGGAGEEVAADVGDQVGAARATVEKMDGSVRGDGGDDEVRDGLAADEVEVGRVGSGPVAPDGDIAGAGGLGDGDIDDDGRCAGGGDAAAAGDGEVDGAVRRDRGGGADAGRGAGIEQPGGGERVQGTRCGGGTRQVIAQHVGDEVGGTGRAVEEVDLAGRADGGDDQIGDGLPGHIVEVRGQWLLTAIGPRGDESRRSGGLSNGDIERDSRDAAGYAAAAADLQADPGVRPDRAGRGRARPVAGVEQASRRDRHVPAGGRDCDRRCRRGRGQPNPDQPNPGQPNPDQSRDHCCSYCAHHAVPPRGHLPRLGRRLWIT